MKPKKAPTTGTLYDLLPPSAVRAYLARIGRKGGATTGPTKARPNARLAGLARWHTPQCGILRNGSCDCGRHLYGRGNPAQPLQRIPVAFDLDELRAGLLAHIAMADASYKAAWPENVAERHYWKGKAAAFRVVLAGLDKFGKPSKP